MVRNRINREFMREIDIVEHDREMHLVNRIEQMLRGISLSQDSYRRLLDTINNTRMREDPQEKLMRELEQRVMMLQNTRNSNDELKTKMESVLGFTLPKEPSEDFIEENEMQV